MPRQGERLKKSLENTIIINLSVNVFSSVWSVLLAILLLLAMITIHEFGHYIVGKSLKFKINEFAIGFGPAIFKRKSKRTGETFSVRALPLGGFCAFDGEEGEGESENSFNRQKPWKRILVLVAGATMNYLLALAIIIVSFSAFGQMSYKINSIEPDPLYTAEYSLANGDIIVGCENKNVYLITDVMNAVNGKSQGDNVQFKVLRNGKTEKITVTLRSDCNIDNSTQYSKVWRALGVGTYETEDGKYWDIQGVSSKFGFFDTIGRSVGYSFSLAGTIFKVLGELVTGNMAISNMGGPVTTIKITSEIASQGTQNFLEIAAYIGVNLAVFNLLPIPALDGSKIVFCAIEWIFKKPVPRKVEAIIHAVGFMLILGFSILVDVLQFI